MKKIIVIFVLFLSFIADVEGQTLKSEMRDFIEPYCKESYYSCFSGRTYIRNSLFVTSVDIDEDNKMIRTRGRHNYSGYLGKTYTDVDWKADISIKGNSVHIVFYKWFTPVIGEGHWEKCEHQCYIEGLMAKFVKLYNSER
ncbi:MAG: hypothetical protein II852_07305 [Bacteroidales bacterium]|nr:hypothetical protein [Bacteroidales bacterium]